MNSDSPDGKAFRYDLITTNIFTSGFSKFTEFSEDYKRYGNIRKLYERYLKFKFGFITYYNVRKRRQINVIRIKPVGYLFLSKIITKLWIEIEKPALK